MKLTDSGKQGEWDQIEQRPKDFSVSLLRGGHWVVYRFRF